MLVMTSHSLDIVFSFDDGDDDVAAAFSIYLLIDGYVYYSFNVYMLPCAFCCTVCLFVCFHYVAALFCYLQHNALTCRLLCVLSLHRFVNNERDTDDCFVCIDEEQKILKNKERKKEGEVLEGSHRNNRSLEHTEKRGSCDSQSNVASNTRELALSWFLHDHLLIVSVLHVGSRNCNDGSFHL